MRCQPLLTAVSIAGSALAICMIMIVIMTREVQTVDYGSEPNRSRTLYVHHSHVITNNGKSHSYMGGMEHEPMKAVFAPMKTPEAVAVYSLYASSIDAMTAGREETSLKVRTVNNDYFKVVALNLIEGRLFTDEECESNAPVAVISHSAARRLFATDRNITGRTITLNNTDYKVRGVVDDVSPMFRIASSEVWIPLNPLKADSHAMAMTGCFTTRNIGVALLAENAGRFDAIRTEFGRRLAEYNKSIAPDTLDLLRQPDEQEVAVNRQWSNEDPDMQAIYLRYAIIFAILLIVPAINIASMTQSRLRQREEEIGVRRAFGATRSAILWQAVTESMVQTLIAGVAGLVLCFVVCALASSYVFAPYWIEDKADIVFDWRILFSPVIYCWALLFCFILNTLSSLVPAWQASRGNIVEALK